MNLSLPHSDTEDLTPNWNPDDWETPNDIAYKMSGLINLSTDKFILEPTAGSGQIAQYLPKGTTCIERNSNRVQKGMQLAPHCYWHCLDYLEAEVGSIFDVIITNPPFSLALPIIERSLRLLNNRSPTARLLFLLPLDFNCGKGVGMYWQSSIEPIAYIHHTYRIKGRIGFLKNGVPYTKRQCYDAVFDIRLGSPKLKTYL